MNRRWSEQKREGGGKDEYEKSDLFNSAVPKGGKKRGGGTGDDRRKKMPPRKKGIYRTTGGVVRQIKDSSPIQIGNGYHAKNRKEKT